MDFEYFRPWLVEGLGYGDGSKGGRPPFDPVSMFKALILQAQHNLSDARMEFMVRDRLSWMRFLGFDLGGPTSDAQWILVALRSAQALFQIPGGVTHLDVKVDDVYAAERIAARLERRTGLTAESWMASNAQLLSALRSQSMSTTLIRVFVLIAVAMGIALWMP